MPLLIVESPAKATTIKMYLERHYSHESNWHVTYTKGHIADLPEKRHGLREDENGKWIGEWEIIQDKADLVKRLRSLCLQYQPIYIGTDDDTEGEKIAEDILEYILTPSKIGTYRRVVFNEITPEAIIEAIENGRLIDENIVNAQIARRFIDRECGYKISNMIRWDFGRQGITSAPNIGVGRVVSPSLHLLVQRESEIEEFVPEKVYRIFVHYQHSGIPFKLIVPTEFGDDSKQELEDTIARLQNPLIPHVVTAFTPKTESRSPYPPLITSRLQRGCWYLFGLEPDTTMKVAQELKDAGLITYHRTDSYRIADKAVLDLITYLSTCYDDEMIVHHKRQFKNKKGAKDAHEAIRPTMFSEATSPNKIESHELFIKASLTKNHLVVYQYIWNVTLATQLIDAVYDVSKVTVQCGDVILEGRANSYGLAWDDKTGTLIPQMGWEGEFGRFISPAEIDGDDKFQEEQRFLPRLFPTEKLRVSNISVQSTTTRRPSRFGIGRFITTLETLGIGRPSTFAQIYKKLIASGSVKVINNNTLMPLPLGKDIDSWISQNAHWLNDIKHAAEFSLKIDEIENGVVDNPDQLVKEYAVLVQDVASKIGYKSHDQLAPTQEQIQIAKQIIIANNLRINDIEMFLQSRDKVKMLIASNPLPHDIALCQCSQCKKGSIISLTHTKDNKELRYYKCTNCQFILWENVVDKFFVSLKKDFAPDELRELIRCVIESKTNGYLVPGLYSQNKKKTFDSKIILVESQHNNKNYWNFGFKPSKTHTKGKN